MRARLGPNDDQAVAGGDTCDGFAIEREGAMRRGSAGFEPFNGSHPTLIPYPCDIERQVTMSTRVNRNGGIRYGVASLGTEES